MRKGSNVILTFFTIECIGSGASSFELVVWSLDTDVYTNTLLSHHQLGAASSDVPYSQCFVLQNTKNRSLFFLMTK